MNKQPQQPPSDLPKKSISHVNYEIIRFRDSTLANVWNYWFAHEAWARLNTPKGGAAAKISASEPAIQHGLCNPFALDYHMNRSLWFRGYPSVDAEIKSHFEKLVTAVGRGEYNHWLSPAPASAGAPALKPTLQEEELARNYAVMMVLLDQMPRNIFRRTPQAFAFDATALALARDAVKKGYDQLVSPTEAIFFYLALTHSEDLDDVEKAVEGMKLLLPLNGRVNPVQRAVQNLVVGTIKHANLLRRFGRYPHRNAVLGRVNTPEEETYLASKEFHSNFMRSQMPTPLSTEIGAPPKQQHEELSDEEDKQQDGESKETKKGPAKPKADAKVKLQEGKKLKILMLHGFRQNGKVFRSRTKKLLHALESFADLVYVTSPLLYQPDAETKEATIAAFGKLPDNPLQRVWWMSLDNNAIYEGFDVSLSFLESVFRMQGPFDGVMGFAQGGTMAALLSAIVSSNKKANIVSPIDFKFAVMISSYPSRAHAHRPYVVPASVELPGLHVLGLQDILVTPDRSRALFGVFAPEHAQLIEHPGGHFVPNLWPNDEIASFAAKFIPEATLQECDLYDQTKAIIDSMVAVRLDKAAFEAKSASALTDISSHFSKLVKAQQWQQVEDLVVHLHSSLALTEAESCAAASSSDRDYLSGFVSSVHSFAVKFMAEQLKDDIAQAVNIQKFKSNDCPADQRLREAFLGLKEVMESDEKLEDESLSLEAQMNDHVSSADGRVQNEELLMNLRYPSTCSKKVPRIDGKVDRTTRFAKDIAMYMYPPQSLLQHIAKKTGAKSVEDVPVPEDFPTKAKRFAYMRYRKTISLLQQLLAETSPHYAVEQMRRLREARVYSPEQWQQLMELPIAAPIKDPTPEPVVPCSLEQLQPLLAYLQSGKQVSQLTAFDKGTVMPDGRLDLCKQVVGPKGIAPLLKAMGSNPHVKSLLLGNNIVGNGGAHAIAEYIKTHKENPLECWYIAGNEFDANGIAEVCEALADDTTATSLWLKRNPLKAAGMIPLSNLLLRNKTIKVLDLVNCGLMDEGLEILLRRAFMGPGANKTLRHLYVGANGITERSAPLIAEFIRDHCELESFFFSSNRLGDKGIAEIAAALKVNHKIQRVCFGSNRIGPIGARALAEALYNHPSIVLLDLGFTKNTVAVGELGNCLGDEGAKAMADLLRNNNKIRHLDLLHNSISQVGVNYIREAMKTNMTLTFLQLTQFGKTHSEIGKEELIAATQRNLALLPPDQRKQVDKIELPDHISSIYSVYRTHS